MAHDIKLDSIRRIQRLESLFLLQRIIRHLALSCVIIFLYLKRGGKAVVCKDLWCDDPRD